MHQCSMPACQRKLGVHYGYIDETLWVLQKLTDTCAVLCSAGAGAFDNIDG